MTAATQQIANIQARAAEFFRADLAVRSRPDADAVFALISAQNRLLDACVAAGMSPSEDQPERWAERFL